MEMPECPVCLQAYDGDATIPRVLSCGHSACESCIALLSSASLRSSSLPDTIRCPACTRVVRYPSAMGPTALPKNIDLLRVCSSLSSSSPSPSHPIQSPKAKPSPPSSLDLLPLPWDDQLFSTWRDWILPSDVISIETITTPTSPETATAATSSSSSSSSSRGGGNCFFRQNQLVSLLPIGASSSLSSLSTESSWFKLSYTARVMEALNQLSNRERDELGFVMAASSRQQRGLCRVYGLWMNPAEENSSLSLVCERFRVDLSGVLKEREKCGLGVNADEMFSWGLVGMEMCEAVMGLHEQGILCGCLAPSCFCFDGYGHCLLDLNNVLMAGWRLRQEIVDTSRRGDGSNPAKIQTCVSPELLMLLHNEGVASNCGSLEVCYGSDAWSLACILVMLLVGDALLTAELFGSFCDKNCCEPCLDQYEAWMKKVVSSLEASLLGSPFESLVQILTSCLNYDPISRPHVSDVWRYIRGLCIKPHGDILACFDIQVANENSVRCLALGDLCSLPKEAGNVSQRLDIDILQGNDNFLDDCSNAGFIGNRGRDGDNFKQDKVDGDIVKGLQGGGSKSITLQGHRDCITGFAVGGGFLFSSSLDKTVHVWSLQDFSHVQTLRGHEHRVMAVLVLDANQLLCISGDSGGCIFVWGIGTPTKQEPLKKWYEHNDWRYSGVHSLAISGSQYLYSGSGDKSIKAWSLQDYSLACTMTGHKSAVSSLLVSDGILYSGSWDGTIRLWLLDDHTPLAVLGDEGSGNGPSVLSLSADCHLLVASYENGFLKMWRNDVLMRSMQIQNGAVFALHMSAKWLFAGGWDKMVHIQELSEKEFQVDLRPVGSIACDSVITSLFYWQGKLFVGLSNKEIKVYYYGS